MDSVIQILRINLTLKSKISVVYLGFGCENIAWRGNGGVECLVLALPPQSLLLSSKKGKVNSIAAYGAFN